MGLLALRPGDLLTILKMALSIGYRSSVSFLSAIQATGLLTFSPVGLSPTEHASLSWTHDVALHRSIAPDSFHRVFHSGPILLQLADKAADRLKPSGFRFLCPAR
jgi:hypothetical protein